MRKAERQTSSWTLEPVGSSSSGSGPLLTRRNRPGSIGITPSTAAGRANRLTSALPKSQSMRTSTSHHGDGIGRAVKRQAERVADGAVRAVGADQITRLDDPLLTTCDQPRAHPIGGRLQAGELGRPLDQSAVVGQALLEGPLGLGLEQRQHEIVTVLHPIEIDRGEEALARCES